MENYKSIQVKTETYKKLLEKKRNEFDKNGVLFTFDEVISKLLEDK